MAERPMLMSAPMVRAILAGTKTQTRRVVKVPHENPLGRWEVMPWGGPNGGRTRDGQTVPFQNVIWHSRTGESIACPYGQPGDRLWVRETWMPDPPINDEWPSTEFHGTRHGNLSLIPQCYRKPFHTLFRASWDGHELIGWRPSIHMPRWASRITLEITAVRVERLQDIGEADAVAEGVAPQPTCRPDDDTAAFSRIGRVHGDSFPIARYAALWEHINGPGSWAANPWVWVVEFKRLEGGAA